MKKSWPFGKLFCKIWITIDDVVTMASVLSIVAITIERYWCINHSVHYRRHTTKTRIRIFSVLIWLIPFLNFAPGIWFLQSSEGNQSELIDNITTNTKFECIGAYHSYTSYLIISQINFFAWPLVVIIVLNALIVVNLYKRSHRFPVFASFRVPENKQKQRKSILREQYRQRTEEEEEQQQQIDNDIQTMTVINETNCCLLDKRDLEVNILV
jgi:growth hormone secretagogue receptor